MTRREVLGQTRWRKFGRSWEAFEKAGLARVGTMVEVGRPREDRRQIARDCIVYLVGDVNQNRGLCDDCVAFDKDAIVYRYVEALSDEYVKKLRDGLKNGT